MAVEKETQLEVWLEENMPEPGGGNPNYVETVTGRIDSIFSSEAEYLGIHDAVASNNATVILSLTGMGQMGGLLSGDGGLTFSGSYFDNASATAPVAGGCVTYDNTGSLLLAKALYRSNWMDLQGSVGVTLIIIHHPLPEN